MIVGGGMVGSALALGWRNRVGKLVLVESSPVAKLAGRLRSQRPCSMIFEPRVKAQFPVASQRLFGGLGAWAGSAGRPNCP